MTGIVHDHLPCGIEYGVMPFPERHIVSYQIRILAGSAMEPPEKSGLARLVTETIDKETQHRTGRELLDAFDAIGAGQGVSAGRESTAIACTVLPQHFERAVALHAEMLRTPTFPEEAFSVNLELAKQELEALEDDAHGLADKLISLQAYGPTMGRHILGERDTLDRIARTDLEGYWRDQYSAGAMLLAVAGAVDARQVADVFERSFGGFGNKEPVGRDPLPIEFSPVRTHHDKDLKQEQIAICWPGVDATHADFPVQQVVLGVLSGGMSGRLFTEVREKRGLAYWVGAWQETPRGAGMMFLGASTTPDRCDETFTTLLSEVDRLAEDIEQSELDRAITGIIASEETRGDTTRARCNELASDLIFFQRPVPSEEKIAKIKAVGIEDIRRYLSTYPRDRLCVVTLGPNRLSEATVDRQGASMRGDP